MTRLRLISYHTDGYRPPGHHDRDDRAARIARVLRALLAAEDTPAVVAVQGLAATGTRAAADTLRHLAAATRLCCDTGASPHRGVAAVAAGRHDNAVGIMWSPDVSPETATWGTITHGVLWHSLAWLTVRVGGRRLTVATYQAPPPHVERHRFRYEADIISTALTANPHHEVWLAGAFTTPASRQRPDGTYHDPEPAPGPGQDTLADRSLDALLASREFVDVAVMYGRPLIPTVDGQRMDRWLWRRGHAPPPQPLGARVIGHHVVDDSHTRVASPHRPVVCTVHL